MSKKSQLISGGLVPGFPPAFAIAQGYKKVSALSDNFNSISTIDVANAQTNGFKWYTQVFNNGDAPTPDTYYGVANSNLNITNNSPSILGTEFGSIAAQSDHAHTGQATIPGVNGFYAEIRCKFPTPSANYKISAWMEDIAGIIASQFNGQSAIVGHIAELDILEWASSNIQQTAHDWTSSTDTQNVINTGSVDTSIYHTYGVLIIPMAANSGTGIARFYIDRVQKGSDLTWTSGATYSCIESSNYILLFGAEPAKTMNIDYFAIATP